jgi:5'-deoxynucleotidase YfbR-like HD superfamily hydrolase
MKEVYNSLAAGRVRRFHTARMVCPQDVAQHSFNVCNLVRLLGGSMYAQLAAIHHDMGEYAVGDIPSPVKREFDTDTRRQIENMEEEGVEGCGLPLVALNDSDVRILKMADNLDGLITCIEEVRMGNTDLVPIGERYSEYLREAKTLHTIVLHFLSRWKELPK